VGRVSQFEFVHPTRLPTLDSGERMEHDKRFDKIELDI
jgi:hypothetical protein